MNTINAFPVRGLSWDKYRVARFVILKNNFGIGLPYFQINPNTVMANSIVFFPFSVDYD